ncbi:MAG TPA: RIP metalloprotease RseP [Methylomirabilota bacterium]
MEVITPFLLVVLRFVVVIGILILVHELGHFFVARWTGVGVERFSIGFGPVLLRWRGKETEYVLSAIPMGGYVKMVGEENPLEGGGGGDLSKAFATKPLWARFLIVFAGPAMNLVLAAVIFTIVLATLGRAVWPAVVGKVAESSPAATAGLRTGDTVVAVDGAPVAYWEDLDRAVARSGGRPLELGVRRDGAEQTMTVSPRLRTVPDPIFREPREVWDLGAGPQLLPAITSIGPGSPAERAGLKPGDVVVAVDGQRLYTHEDLLEAIRARAGQSLELGVERDGAPLTLTVSPEPVKERTPTGEEVTVGKIQAGLAPKAVKFEPYAPAMAIGQGVVKTWDMTVLTARGLWKLVTRQIDLSNIGGPIQIATETTRQANEGLVSVAVFVAVISVNLAVLNLLPIPMLDGGHLLFFVIEAILGRPLSLRKRELAQQVGFVLLMMIMVFALYNDLTRLNLFKSLR